MAEPVTAEIEDVLNSFAEAMSGLMIDQYQKHIAEMELTLPQAQVLRTLSRGAVTTGQLAEDLQISASAITQLTDRLIRKGLVERRATIDDRRCVIVALSAEGASLVEQFCQRRLDFFGGALAQFSVDDREQAIGVLEKVAKALENHESCVVVAPKGKYTSTKKKQKNQYQHNRV